VIFVPSTKQEKLIKAMKNETFRKAALEDADDIWEILRRAIARRKEDGSNQWQDGYPNPEAVQKDICNGHGFVMCRGDVVLGYAALLINDEPEYDNLEGAWLTHEDFVVFHRVAISENHLGKGLAKKMFGHIEDFAKQNNINSVKADTNFDNPAMLYLFESCGYHFCGTVYFRGSPRKAYEKVLLP
jgi:GNAT superfamily N-acetyltransferase